jgi:hypothetical protein
MAAPLKNDFWKQRTTHGRDKIFSTPEIFMDACNQYFEWAIENPLMETIIQGGKEFIVPKMRAFTLKGLCIFLDISAQTFIDYCNYKDFVEVTTRVTDIIYTQKFEGSAAGFLNPNIIARDLGLKDTTKTEHSGQLNITPLTWFGEDE